MPDNGSVTTWLAALRNGDSTAAQRCWEVYFDRLVRLARAKLAAKRRTLQDPEDIALSALKSFCLAAERGRFPKLNDRHDLWQILVMLTARKTIDALRYENPRPNPAPLPDRNGSESSAARSIDDIIGIEPTPGLIVEIAENCERLRAILPDDLCRQIVDLKLQEFTNQEIAAQVNKSLATVERKLALARRLWEEHHG